MKFRPLVLALSACLAVLPLRAQEAPPTASALDAPLFYQLLIGELELQRGEFGVAYQVLLDAARRTQSEALYRRAIGIALQARAGNEALSAARAWRAQLGGAAALQHVVQLSVALGQLADAAEPMVDWLQQTPEVLNRAALLTSTPQLLRNVNPRERALNDMEPALAKLRDDAQAPPQRRQLAALLIAQLARHAGNEVLALNQLREADKELPGDALPAWAALDLMRLAPDAEQLVLPRLNDDPRLHLAYAQTLARDQRTLESLAQYQQLRSRQPEVAAHLLAIGSLELELRHPEAALTALDQYLATDEAKPAEARAGALLLKAQALAQQRNWTAALRLLDEIPAEQRSDEQLFRRASIEAQQGQLAKARERLRGLPGDTPEQRERRLLLEVQVLRDANQWPAAFELLGDALKDDPKDIDLLYEHAMSAERLGRFELMEQQLRRIIELNPRHHHAHNALGYSLADRNLRLAEARELIERAIELGGHEPFLVDSLGWVAFREGRYEEAERLLRQAHRARPDAEIAAHLVELLWQQGRADEARQLFGQAAQREPDNAVLKATRKRLGL